MGRSQEWYSHRYQGLVSHRRLLSFNVRFLLYPNKIHFLAQHAQSFESKITRSHSSSQRRKGQQSLYLGLSPKGPRLAVDFASLTLLIVCGIELK